MWGIEFLEKWSIFGAEKYKIFYKTLILGVKH